MCALLVASNQSVSYLEFILNMFYQSRQLKPLRYISDYGFHTLLISSYSPNLKKVKAGDSVRELSKVYKVQKPRLAQQRQKAKSALRVCQKGNITNTERIRSHPSRIILDRSIVQKRLDFGSQTGGNHEKRM